MNTDKPATPKDHLDFSALGRTHRSFGGGPWSFVSNIISQNMPRFGSAVERIELTIFCNGILVNDHRDFPPLSETESVRFFRKKKLISITYPSSQFTPDEAFSLLLPALKRTHFRSALDDLIAALNWGLRQRITTKDDFDTDAFLAWIGGYSAREFASDEVFRTEVRDAFNAAKARHEQMDPWEKLCIDWDEMAPNAREILDDPIDWSTDHAYSPHGNDTGADIFVVWAKYKDLSARQVALRLGWRDNELDIENELFWQDWVKIHLALAFGHIKHAGTCNSELALEGRDILEKEMQRIATTNNWPQKEEYLSRMARYFEILQQFT